MSHTLLPTLIVFPIFNQIFEHSHELNGGESIIETIVFVLIIIPVSLLVTFIHTKITKKEHCCEHGEYTLACETCPHRDEAKKYIESLHLETK